MGNRYRRSKRSKYVRHVPALFVVGVLAAGFGVAQWQAVADANDLKDAQAAAARTAEEAASRGVARSDASTTTTSEVTTTTTEAPTTVPPTTVPPTTAPPTTAKPATTVPPRPPTTAAPKPPPAPAAEGANSESGKASYYSYKAGGCAHRTLPKGTVVTVTNVANGKTTTCVVNDRGPFIAGRIIDLDVTVFRQIGSTSAGVLSVRISW
jgi:rare lipoprotein A (peptidoglycan hydrolase)